MNQKTFMKATKDTLKCIYTKIIGPNIRRTHSHTQTFTHTHKQTYTLTEPKAFSYTLNKPTHFL